MLLYADDAVVFAKSSESLQSMFHDIEIYCGTWNLKINTSKANAMICERGRILIVSYILTSNWKWFLYSNISAFVTGLEPRNVLPCMRLTLCTSCFLCSNKLNCQLRKNANFSIL